MNGKNRILKWAIVIVPVVAAALAIYPPERKLKAGIDLAGGSSLLFEIDTSGLEPSQKSGLAARVMAVLKRRVDPNGQLNLVWRPIGNNRLEIQMPRPPREALERREVYESARSKLRAFNISRLEVEAMLNASPEARDSEQAALARGLSERRPMLESVVATHETHLTARQEDDATAEDAARFAYEQALEAVLRTSVDLGHLEDILALENETERASELGKVTAAHTSEEYRRAIDGVVEAYDAWAMDKGVLEDPSDLKRRIRGAGVLEFRILAERDSGNPSMTTHARADLKEPISKYTEQLQKRGRRPRPNDKYRWFEVKDVVDFTNSDSLEAVERNKGSMGVIVEKYAGKWYSLAHAGVEFGLLRGGSQKWKLVSAFQGVDPKSGGPAVNFGLDARGGGLFATLTSNNLQRPLAIVLDDVMQSFATINSTIRENGQISGVSYTREDVDDLISTLQAGSLPARLIETPLMEKTIGPSLGEHNREMGMWAAIYGGVAVALFIILYYRFAGTIAFIALALNLLFVLALMATTQATFTLPGIAGFILTVGMAVDANVLIFERIREELDRGVGLRKALRTGYERAFSTIIDANVTTLITCIILGYLGTEEVKGFAMVLGFGITTSMFTSLFVTRLIFDTLIDKGMLKTLSMTRLFHRPSIDWIGFRRTFWPVSVVACAMALGLTVFVSVTNKEALFDIEFLGGTSVQLEMKPGQTITDEEVRHLVSATSGEEMSVVRWLNNAADALADVTVTTGTRPNSFVLSSSSLTGEQMESLIRKELEPKVERGGFVREGGSSLTLDVKVDQGLDVAGIKSALVVSAQGARSAAVNLSNARIQTVEALEATDDEGDAFEVITVETNKELVRSAILATMGPMLKLERALSFELVTHPKHAPLGYWPIEEDSRYLSDVIDEPDANYDIRRFKGGVVIVLDKLEPPISTARFERRLREIRLLPEFSQFEARPYKAIGLESSETVDGEVLYSKIAYTVVDESIPYYDDPANWETFLAAPETTQVREALATEKSLRKVIQFAPQVAGQTQQQALVAIVMALTAIVAYIWIRFGQMQFGLAAIIALVHDVSVTLGLVAVSHYVYATVVGRALGLADFKIDLPMIAAFLTIIGYSLNDTIVMFDRIRENRGKLKTITTAMINNSINQCLSRTVLTSVTTFLAVSIMYAFGGSGIHGFSFALMVGVIVGTYSSVGIAAPLLQHPRALHLIVYVLLAVGVFGAFAMTVGTGAGTLLTVAGLVIGAVLLWAVMLEMRSSRRAPAMAGGV